MKIFTLIMDFGEIRLKILLLMYTNQKFWFRTKDCKQIHSENIERSGQNSLSSCAMRMCEWLA